MNTVNVLVTRPFPDAWLDQWRAISPRLVVTAITTEDAAGVPPAVWAATEVLYAGGALPDPAQAPRLRWVQMDTAGVDHVRPLPLWCSDVALTTLAGVAPSNMAEFVLMMMMAFGHRLRLMLTLQGQHHWPSPQFRWAQFTPFELRGATVGIVGYGNIGRELGRLAHAFGMRVLGLNSGRPRAQDATYAIPALAGLPGTEPEALYTPESLLAMLPQCDYVVLITPYTSATHHLINASALRAMKPSAVLINVARGGVVDEAALLQALREGWIAGAALDVFAQEPLPPDHPFWDMDNVIISPHIAGLTARYYPVVGELFAENLRRYLDGLPLLNQVDRKREY